MRYTLYDGGDYIGDIQERFRGGFSNSYGPVEPTGHHKTRHHVLENHIDTQSRVFRGNWEAALNEGSDYPLRIVEGDEFTSHLLGSGWVVNRVVFHNQRVSSGLLTPSIEIIDGKTYKSNTVIDLSKVGHTVVTFEGLTDLGTLTEGNGVLVWGFKPAPVKEPVKDKEKEKDRLDVPDGRFDMCGSIFLDITNYNSEYTCDCAPYPCDTRFPDPNCIPNL